MPEQESKNASAQGAQNTQQPQGAPNAQQPQGAPNAQQGVNGGYGAYNGYNGYNGQTPPNGYYGAPNGYPQNGYPQNGYPQNGYNGYQPPYGYTAQPPQSSLSVLSILGFVFAFVASLVGLILSIIAFNNAKREGDLRSQNFSRAGIIVSSVMLGVYVLIVILAIVTVFIVAAGSIGTMAPYPYY